MARTRKNEKFYIATTVADGPIPAIAGDVDLTQAEFEALTWTEITNVGTVGDFGLNTNLISYDELSTTVTQKGKGVTDAGSPEIQCARNSGSNGQVAMTAAGDPFDSNNYAFKREMNDGTPTTTPTTYYNRGVVTGPVLVGGGVEDFDLIVFTMGLNQAQIEVLPTTI